MILSNESATHESEVKMSELINNAEKRKLEVEQRLLQCAQKDS